MSANTSVRSTVEDRWRTIMVGADRFNGESTNSRTYSRLSDTLRVIVARMIHGSQGDDEYTALSDLEQSIIEDIERRIIDFAVSIERQRVSASEVAA